ncbi:MAG: DEAD/DEAH box helicase [Patescibacteria group bacterium]|nr:DEAD/DEAH box helicase [Patescibacteria group bacterium]
MKKFKELGLNAQILKSLAEFGYQEATPIQEQAIPFILKNNRDLIGLAQTGTGKTAAFGLPILNKLKKEKEVQAIILCPTRELCLQINKEMLNFSKHLEDAKTVAVYGGVRIDSQIREIRSGAKIVVGTPGRVLDLIKRKVLKLQTIRFVVLDEADEMLDLGFKDDLDKILSETPEEKQVLLFSATMSSVIRNIAKKYMSSPEEISIGKKNIGADQVEHQYYLVKPGQKYEALRRIVDSEPDIYGILFCRTRNETKEIADRLKEDRYSTEALHGDISQDMRTIIMDRFRSRKIQLLVATDVAARGIDVNDLTHVINYNLPDANEVYLHRSGRTGRAQKKGISLSIVTVRELRKIHELEQKVAKNFQAKTVPTGKDICAKQLFHLVEKIKETEVDEKELAQFLPVFEKELKNLSRQELLNRFISVEFNHFINLYKNNQDLEVVSVNQYSDGREDKIKKDRLPDEEFVNIRLDLGKKDGFNVKTLFAMVNSLSELKGAAIGKIKLADSFTIFGIDRKKRSVVIDSFDSILYDNKSFETSFADEGDVDRTSRVFVKKPAGRSFNRRREERRGKKRR